MSLGIDVVGVGLGVVIDVASGLLVTYNMVFICLTLKCMVHRFAGYLSG
jgi:hypothetical protein